MKQTLGATLASDTSPEAERVQVGLWRAMSPSDKAQAVGRLCLAVRELSLAGIRDRHPSASEQECRSRYALLTLGRSLSREAYPDIEFLLGR